MASPVQSLKAFFPIYLTLFGILIEVSDVQPSKTPLSSEYKLLLPIESTPLGRFTEVRLVQYRNVPSSILVTLLGIVIAVSPLQPEKVPPSILVILLGILIEVSPLHPKKAPPPILVTLLGILIEVSPVQFSYLQPIITQYFIDNKSEIWLLFLIAHSKR